MYVCVFKNGHKNGPLGPYISDLWVPVIFRQPILLTLVVSSKQFRVPFSTTATSERNKTKQKNEEGRKKSQRRGGKKEREKKRHDGSRIRINEEGKKIYIKTETKWGRYISSWPRQTKKTDLLLDAFPFSLMAIFGLYLYLYFFYFYSLCFFLFFSLLERVLYKHIQ